MENFKVAVDGLSGSGKTTMAKLSAKRLNFFYLETGSFYRAFTFEVLRRKVDYKDIKRLKPLLLETRISFRWDGERVKIYLNREDVTDKLRQPMVDKMVSYISEIKEVREKMVKLQRRIVKGRNVICEGRDIGSVVFPDADLKVFVDCDLRERARRRKKELSEKGISVALPFVIQNLRERDRIDSQRVVSPLIKLPEAVYIDTTNLTIEEEVEILVGLIKALMKDRCEI